MLKYITVILLACTLQACGTPDQEKYDLKSPCVAAESNNPSPCQRRPANKWLG